MHLSIALATCNGQEFLAEQLESLRRQRRLPDELIVVDDASTDGTLALLTTFKRDAPFEVTIIQNTERGGPLRSFLTATRACRSEIVALCDQDDIWLPEKLAACESALATGGAGLVLHSLAHIRFEQQRWMTVDRLELPSATMDGLRTRPERLFRGMSMVFHKSLLDRADEAIACWDPYYRAIEAKRTVSMLDHWTHAHDLLIFMLAKLRGSVTFLRPILAEQRWHAKNYTGPREGQVSDETSKPAEANVSSAGSYEQVSVFCGEMARFLREHFSSLGLTGARRDRAVESYERWSRVYGDRARLYIPGASPKTRLTKFLPMIAAGHYWNGAAGGLGFGSLLKDAATTARGR